MSDILISNAKLPTDCFTCGYEKLTENCPCYIGVCSASEYKDSRHPDCPLKELSSHGRLKDVDDIINRLILKPMHDMISTLLSIQSAIDESPTVIPASDGE